VNKLRFLAPQARVPLFHALTRSTCHPEPPRRTLASRRCVRDRLRCRVALASMKIRGPPTRAPRGRIKSFAQPYPCGTARGPGKHGFGMPGVEAPQLCSVEERPFRAVKTCEQTPLPCVAGPGPRRAVFAYWGGRMRAGKVGTLK
jgi:hypothetical protein